MGNGSNQYQNLGHSPSPVSTRRDSAAAAASVTPDSSDGDTEDIAWRFHPDRQAWAQIGVVSYPQMLAWQKLGWPPNEIRAWSSRGFTAGEARTWSSDLWDHTSGNPNPHIQFDAETAAYWRLIGVSVQDAKTWHQYQYGPAEAHTWRTLAHIDDASDAAWWTAESFTVHEAAAWRTVGVLKPDTAADLRGEGLSPPLCAVVQHDVTDPDFTDAWIAALRNHDLW